MSDKAQDILIRTQRLNRADYAIYGDIIGALDDLPFAFANMKTARRFNFLADVTNLRPSARLNLCLFRTTPAVEWPLEIKLLERHEFSTQVFLPMHNAASYLVVVARGGSEPDLSTVKAFLVTGPQGISYKPGIWHYPITAIGQEIDFACLVHEDGSKADCHIHNLQNPLFAQLSD